jgi:hypothetical protein
VAFVCFLSIGAGHFKLAPLSFVSARIRVFARGFVRLPAAAWQRCLRLWSWAALAFQVLHFIQHSAAPFDGVLAYAATAGLSGLAFVCADDSRCDSRSLMRPTSWQRCCGVLGYHCPCLLALALAFQCSCSLPWEDASLLPRRHVSLAAALC